LKHPPNPTLGQSIRNSTQWLVSGGIGNKILDFIFGVILARLLAPADFGMLVTVQIFSGIAGFISSAGLGQALIHAKDAEISHFRVAFTLQLLSGCAIYAFFYLTAPWFGIWYDQPLFADLMRVSALTFLIRPFSNIAGARLSRQMRFKAQAIIALLSALFTGIIGTSLAYTGLGVWSLVLAGVLSAFLNSTLLCVAARWMPGIAFDLAVARSLGGYGAKITGRDFLVYVRSQLSNLLISRALNPAAVGLFNKADSLANLPVLTISGAVYQPTFRALSSIRDNLDKSKYLYFRAITLVLVYTLPFYVGLWWLARPFIEVVYGEQWMDSARPLEIMAMGGLFRCISNQSGAVIAAQRRVGKQIVILLETIALTGLGTVIGIRWGIEGVAFGILFTTVYTMVRMSGLAHRCVNAGLADLLLALSPALKLNGILCLALFAADRAFFGGLASTRPALYLLGMGALGGLAYILGFLFLPIGALEQDAARWKSKLKVIRPQSLDAAAGSQRSDDLPARPRRRWLLATGITTLLMAALALIHWHWVPLDELWITGRRIFDQASAELWNVPLTETNRDE
jgi:teichuronic acid exporter